MSDYTDLIADARVWPRDGVSKGPLINALADAIEALVKERDQAIRDLDAGFAESDHLSAKYYQRMRAAEKEAAMRRSESADFERERDALQADLDAEVDKNARYRTRNDELAAVIEKLGLVAKECPSITTVDVLLSAAPADALREHDAELIEGLADTYASGRLTGVFAGRDDYTRAWLRERARQVREGEA